VPGIAEVDRARDTYSKYLLHEEKLALDSPREAAAFDAEAQQLENSIFLAEKHLDEMPDVSQVDAGLDFYNELQEAVRGRLEDAKSVVDTNASLRTLLAEVYVTYSSSGDLTADFFFADMRTATLDSGGVKFFDVGDLPDIALLPDGRTQAVNSPPAPDAAESGRSPLSPPCRAGRSSRGAP
jgi:hypothetical protein